MRTMWRILLLTVCMVMLGTAVQAAEKLTPPITAAQAKELLAALKDARYLMGGLPLASIDTADGTKVRVDL